MNLSRMRLRCSLALATMVWLLFPGLVLAEELVVPETTQPAHPPTHTDALKADPTPAVTPFEVSSVTLGPAAAFSGARRHGCGAGSRHVYGGRRRHSVSR